MKTKLNLTEWLIRAIKDNNFDTLDLYAKDKKRYAIEQILFDKNTHCILYKTHINESFSILLILNTLTKQGVYSNRYPIENVQNELIKLNIHIKLNYINIITLHNLFELKRNTVFLKDTFNNITYKNLISRFPKESINIILLYKYANDIIWHQDYKYKYLVGIHNNGYWYNYSDTNINNNVDIKLFDNINKFIKTAVFEYINVTHNGWFKSKYDHRINNFIDIFKDRTISNKEVIRLSKLNNCIEYLQYQINGFKILIDQYPNIINRIPFAIELKTKLAKFTHNDKLDFIRRIKDICILNKYTVTIDNIESFINYNTSIDITELNDNTNSFISNNNIDLNMLYAILKNSVDNNKVYIYDKYKYSRNDKCFLINNTLDIDEYNNKLIYIIEIQINNDLNSNCATIILDNNIRITFEYLNKYAVSDDKCIQYIDILNVIFPKFMSNHSYNTSF